MVHHSYGAGVMVPDGTMQLWYMIVHDTAQAWYSTVFGAWWYNTVMVHYILHGA